MDWDPAQVFNAAQELAATVIQNAGQLTAVPSVRQLGRYRRGIVFGDSRESLPSQHPGALGTTGGLSIHTVNYKLAWIECPWGEWCCFGWSPLESSIGLYGVGDPYMLRALRDTLCIDSERSRAMQHAGNEVWAIGQVGTFNLPTYEHTGAYRSQGEWMQLCNDHNPPLPYPESMDWHWRGWRAQRKLPHRGFV